MNKLIPIFCLCISIISLNAQNNYISFTGKKGIPVNPEPVRVLDDKGLAGLTTTYYSEGSFVFDKKVNNTVYQELNIPGFSTLQEVGKPALPAHIDIIAIPNGATATVHITETQTMHYSGYLIHPALKPADDTKGAPDPAFEIDNQFYQSDIIYPQQPVKIIGTWKLRGITMALVQVCPMQYNPLKKDLTVYSKLKYEIKFSSGGTFIPSNDNSEEFLNHLPNYFLNNKAVSDEVAYFLNEIMVSQKKSKLVNGKNIIIITHTDYIQAADSFALWKEQLGYTVEILSQSNWTSAIIRNEIQKRYISWNPKPDYIIFVGDNDKVPGIICNDPDGNQPFASDLYYTCMDGSSDYIPDIARGRISVATPTQAMNVVLKIINYERNPINNNAFYNKAIACAYFQDENKNGYADRRFAQTSEELRDYLVNKQGLNVDRIYYTFSDVNPQYWNNGIYSNGEPIPSYLKKPTFAWNGGKWDIANAINQGALFITHRDHGYVGGTGWGYPEFLTSDITLLNNGNKLPIVFSINCHTGEFQLSECFAERFLRYNNGGAAGVFAAAYFSKSGYNDALICGLIDAIWANPGLVPNFTGRQGIRNPVVTPHSNIYTMGNVLNHGLVRMVQTWGGIDAYIRYQHELYHYFGDPTMKIWTANPTPILANHINNIQCTDSVLVITNSTCPNGLATIVSNGEIIGKTTLIDGEGIIKFSSLAGGTQAILTISQHNYKPYISKLTIVGNCPKASFTINENSICLENNILVTNHSIGIIDNYSWNFGQGAIPETANTPGPHIIQYSSAGIKNITLTVSNNELQSTYSEQVEVKELCEYTMPVIGSVTYTGCTGKLFDDGGPLFYSDKSYVTTTILPEGAQNVTLTFNSFNFENGFDYLYIYDGPNTQYDLIGSFTGNILPNGGTIHSTRGAITLVQFTDENTNASGFELIWTCNKSTQAPKANFTSNATNTCRGNINFNDLSINGPTRWYWDFGDGTTSTEMTPIHIYDSSGVFTVKLKVENEYGSDSVEKVNLISSNRMQRPTVTSAYRCSPGSLNISATGQGAIKWYNAQTGGNTLYTGNNFYTSYQSSEKIYWVEDNIENESKFVGKKDTTGGLGLFFISTSTHYLIFDCYSPVTLVSVKVYSSQAGERVITLCNSNGTVIQSATINIPEGESRVVLNFNIPVGTNLRLCGPTKPYLYRNSTGASYPYTLSGLLSIKSSSSTSNPQNYYYYFYDWEIKEPACTSPRVPVYATVFNAVADINVKGKTGLCKGDSVVFTASSSRNYLWLPTGETSQQIIVRDSGTYQLIVSDSICFDTTKVSVTMSDTLPVAAFTYSNQDTQIVFTNYSVHATKYFWSFGDGRTSFETNPIHKYNNPGKYTVSLIAENNCGKDTVVDSVNFVGIIDINSISDIIQIYPNPAKNVINIICLAELPGNFKINIFDIVGNCLRTKEFFGTVETIDISDISCGIYFVEINTKNSVGVKKLIISR